MIQLRRWINALGLAVKATHWLQLLLKPVGVFYRLQEGIRSALSGSINGSEGTAVKAECHDTNSDCSVLLVSLGGRSQE